MSVKAMKAGAVNLLTKRFARKDLLDATRARSRRTRGISVRRRGMTRFAAA
jgi:FixJ family two-component response regulator